LPQWAKKLFEGDNLVFPKKFLSILQIFKKRCMNTQTTHQQNGNVCSTEKYTKRSCVLLLRLVYFSAKQMLAENAATLKPD